MGWWREHVVPRMVDRLLDVDRVHEIRSRACSGLRGQVLEIGFGSGLNLAHYPRAVAGVWAVEPSRLAWRLAQPRIDSARCSVTRAGLDGERLDLDDASFDTALSTFTMCTIPDVDAALAEVARVLRPGGVLHFAEHGRSPDAAVARWQDRLQPVHGRMAGGCHLDRPIREHLERSPLVVEALDSFYERGPKPLSYIFLGTARKPRCL